MITPWDSRLHGLAVLFRASFRVLSQDHPVLYASFPALMVLGKLTLLIENQPLILYNNLC